MNIQKTLSHLGFQPSDYILSGSVFEIPEEVKVLRQAARDRIIR